MMVRLDADLRHAPRVAALAGPLHAAWAGPAIDAGVRVGVAQAAASAFAGSSVAATHVFVETADPAVQHVFDLFVAVARERRAVCRTSAAVAVRAAAAQPGWGPVAAAVVILSRAPDRVVPAPVVDSAGAAIRSCDPADARFPGIRETVAKAGSEASPAIVGEAVNRVHGCCGVGARPPCRHCSGGEVAAPFGFPTIRLAIVVRRS